MNSEEFNRETMRFVNEMRRMQDVIRPPIRAYRATQEDTVRDMSKIIGKLRDENVVLKDKLDDLRRLLIVIIHQETQANEQFIISRETLVNADFNATIKTLYDARDSSTSVWLERE